MSINISRMSHSVKFLLNGVPCEASGLSPTTTVLQFLRLHKRLTGTKEGCAEGDCGACTAIIGEIENGAVRYKTINTCIVFLPVLDGKHLVTVEYLKTLSGGKPHPAQQAMVDCHASQCGFCTPGFVMSIAALCHNNADAECEDIQDSLAGNLCRCTGYRPILDAARQACQSKARLETDPGLLKGMQRDETFSYECGGSRFFAPRTVAELAALLETYPSATLLAGGTDAGLWVTKLHRPLPLLIYTGHVAEMKRIGKTPVGLEIGAGVSYADAFDELSSYDPSLRTLLGRLGSVQVRNLGTLGGNIANGSPIGDGMPPLIALGARIALRSHAGTREVNLEDYFLAYKKQDRKEGEFIEKIIIPEKASGVLFRTYKVSKRFDQDISAVCAGFALHVKDGRIASARLAYGGMAATPKRAAKTEGFLTGKTWSRETAQAAMAEIAQDYAPLSDMRASAEYRLAVAQNLLLRFFLETQGGAETGVYRYGG